MLTITVFLVLVVVPLLSVLSITLLGLNGSWDATHHVTFSIGGYIALFEAAMGVSSTSFWVSAWW